MGMGMGMGMAYARLQAVEARVKGYERHGKEDSDEPGCTNSEEWQVMEPKARASRH
jgi:hypothetical protein